MNYIKLFENFNLDIKETTKDILIDWHNFTIETLEYENKLYVFIVTPDTPKKYFTLKEDMKQDLFKLIDYVSYEEYNFSKFYVYFSMYLNNPNDFKDNLYKAIKDKHYKKVFISKLIDKNMELMKIDGDKIIFDYDNIELTNKLAIGFILLTFDKNQ